MRGFLRSFPAILVGAAVLGGCQSPKEPAAPVPEAEAVHTTGQPVGAAILTLGIT